MPWPPAFSPVIKFDQATGLCGGMLVVSRRNERCLANCAKFGILPSAINFVSRSGSRPSIPRMIIFRACDDPPRACPQEVIKPRLATHKANRLKSRRCFLKHKAIASKLLQEFLYQ